MTAGALSAARVVRAVHGVREIKPDPDHEMDLAQRLKAENGRPMLLELYGRFAHGLSDFDFMMRRILWRALCKRTGHGLQIEPQVCFKHIETFEIGDGVFIGANAYLQGRHDGTCMIGDRAWIGPQAYFDARDLVIEADVGWGPGAKVLGSQHTALPVDRPIIQSDLEIRPVRIEAGSDIGTNAVILPGVTVGHGSIVGAGAVVTESVPPFAVVAGVPARVIRSRATGEGA